MRKLEGRVRSRYHVPLSEVDEQDTWQRIVLGFAIVSADRISVERTSADISSFIEGTGLAELVRDEHELLAYGDGPFGDDGAIALATVQSTEESVLSGEQSGDNPRFADEAWIPDAWKSEEMS